MVSQQPDGQRIPIEPWEVGGELLDILSRGLYTDAKDAVREYIQNSVDANAANIHLTIDGPVVTIRDDGTGMDFTTLRRARRLGASDKEIMRNVGFRGIGMYAAFGMCDTLTIQTHQAGATEMLELKMHFGQMSSVLERDRHAIRRSSIALTDLLFEHTAFRRVEHAGDRADQFTMVRLEGLRSEYRSQLANLSDVHGYLLNTLPIAYPDDAYGPAVNNWLRDSLKLKPVKVILRVGKEPEVIVRPQIATDVLTPQATYITDSDGIDLAFMWSALTTNGERVSTGRPGASDTDVSGFLLKTKGFTLGDRLNLKPLWPLVGARTLYHHYTGELHVLDGAGVTPNAARNGLEAGRPREVLYRYVEERFAVLNSNADVARQLLKVRNDLAGAEDEARQLLSRRDDPDQSPFELYRLSKNFIVEVERSEAALKRLRGRGRSKRAKTVFPPSEAQKQEIAELLAWVKRPKDLAGRVVSSTESKTNTRSRESGARQPTPPQVAILEEALHGLAGMRDILPTDAYDATQDALEAALSLQIVPNAVAALDDVKARGFTLTENVEASRRKLRSHLGWSATAPVSLSEALAQDGFLASSSRERALIEAVDNGLRSGLGGRGEAYENLLRAIAESISEHSALG